ncbi:MAG: glycosyltransferase family 9 protein [Myxococcota bacterium]|nr:glycosyltransferase family 9 protein [Myxococcota bacterium]
MNIFKKFELAGRQWLIRLLGALFGVRHRELTLSSPPKILVVRLDERVGNLILLTPLLTSLRRRFPDAQLDLLANPRGKALLEGHPDIDRILLFEKRNYFGRSGPFAIFRTLRRNRYDLAIDAGNPLGPSTTQTLVVWLSGANNTIGVQRRDQARLFTQTVIIPPEVEHEIDLRLQLLNPLPGTARTREVSVGPLPKNKAIDALVRSLPKKWVVLNIGARLLQKQLSVQDYAEVTRSIQQAGFSPLLTWGPAEKALAANVAEATGAPLAPPTSLHPLSSLMQQANAVVTCDTGPMHLAVAVGTPTFGIFVCTDPKRFGYSESPHQALDAQEGWRADYGIEMKSWLQGVLPQAAEPRER